MSEKLEDEGEIREGRYYPKLGEAEITFIRKEAKRHNVTPNAMFEVMMLSFFKQKAPDIYKDAKQHASPMALTLIEKAEAKELAETRKLIQSVRIDDGEAWTETYQNFYVYAKGDTITIPKKVMDALKIKDGMLLNLQIQEG